MYRMNLTFFVTSEAVGDALIDAVEDFVESQQTPLYPPRHGEKWSDDEREALLDLVTEGMYSIEDIADELDRTPYAIVCQLDYIFTSAMDWRKIYFPNQPIPTSETAKEHGTPILFSSVEVEFSNSPLDEY